MLDHDLLSLCVLLEAGGEPEEGQAAIARVILNRMRLRYSSDGTVVGTVLKFDQFSWAWFSFVDGKYKRIADDLEQAEEVAQKKYLTCNKQDLASCGSIVDRVFGHMYQGPLYDKLTDLTVLYLNPKISKQPWATPTKLDVAIGHHNFYHA